MRPAWTMLAALALLLALAGVHPAEVLAAPVESEDRAASSAAPPGSDLETAAPPRGLPVEQERDPGHGPTPHEPLFLEPAATSTERARLGLSAWIAPGAPFDRRENPGGPAVGFTIAWPPPDRHVPSSGPSPWHGSATR